MVEILSLQIYFRAVMLAQPAGMVERRGASYVVMQELTEFFVEFLVVGISVECLFQPLHICMQYFRHVRSSEMSVVAVVVYGQDVFEI